MEKYKMVACALAFGLCSLISNAGCPEGSKCSGIENESSSVCVSFNDETYSAQNAQAAPNRGFGLFKKGPATPRYGDKRTILTMKDRPEVVNFQGNQLLRPENHLCEVSKTTEVFTKVKFKDTSVVVDFWLPKKNNAKGVVGNNFEFYKKPNNEVTQSTDVQSSQYGWRYSQNVDQARFQTTGILTSNKPFIEGTRKKTDLNVQAEGYFGHIIEKFNKLDGSKQKLDSFFRRNTGLNLGKDVELKWAKKGSAYDNELAKMEKELKNSNHYWAKGTKGKSYLAWAGDLGIARDSSIEHAALELERVEANRRNFGMFGFHVIDYGPEENVKLLAQIRTRKDQELEKRWLGELFTGYDTLVRKQQPTLPIFKQDDGVKEEVKNAFIVGRRWKPLE